MKIMQTTLLTAFVILVTASFSYAQFSVTGNDNFPFFHLGCLIVGGLIYDFENPEVKSIQVFHALQRTGPGYSADQIYEAGQKFGLYRWHLTDPVRFQKNLKVTIQAAVGRMKGDAMFNERTTFLRVAYWYQAGPHKKFSTLPSPVGSESKQ